MSPLQFLALAEKGLEGEFRLTYRIEGEGGTGGSPGVDRSSSRS
jgi:hypothetical protein